MLTQNHPSISSAIRTQHTHMGIQVFLGSQLLGTVEVYPVWGLGSISDAAIAQGLTLRDDCYLANNFPYRYLESAIGAITGAHLKQAATDTIPDYI
jgi:galactose-1-phosphate uridylyltransferase